MAKGAGVFTSDWVFPPGLNSGENKILYDYEAGNITEDCTYVRRRENLSPLPGDCITCEYDCYETNSRTGSTWPSRVRTVTVGVNDTCPEKP